jgi:hypothetical protein
MGLWLRSRLEKRRAPRRKGEGELLELRERWRWCLEQFWISTFYTQDTLMWQSQAIENKDDISVENGWVRLFFASA